MDAIVTAGGIPDADEPLYGFTQGKNKATLDIAGKPMIQWVLDALDGAQAVENVVIAGLDETDEITCKKLAAFVPNQGSMLDNIRAGGEKILSLHPESKHMLTVSSDIPAITPAMVTWLVETCQETDHEVYYTVIPKHVMETRYPASRRSYVHLRGLEVCGGDMNVIRSNTISGRKAVWDRIIDARKNALKQAALVGYDTLFLLMIRALSLDGAVKTASKRLGLNARAIISPYAEIGMDVDKPHQLEIMRADLARQAVS